jgi:hypothetical protein
MNKKFFALTLAMISLVACSDDDNNTAPVVIETPSVGAIFGTTENPLNVGGPNQQNQVYVDLSGEDATPVGRASWDLGFYSGSEARVVINGSVKVAVKQLATSNIDEVQVEDETVAVGTFDATNMAYIDNPTGELSGTAFGAIATSEATAKVYLVNLGNAVPTVAPATGSANVSGEARGWRKVKVWTSGNAYKLQYANLDATTHTEVTINKDAEYNHTFFSLTTNNVVTVEPKKDKWDLNFTTFTNEVFMGAASYGAYFYSDYIVTNTKAGVTSYKVDGDDAAYEAFDLTDVATVSFSTDQRAIGANWRNVTPVQLYDNVFFIVKDGSGNVYKVKFISMLNTAGERGFPTFQYSLLQ